MALLISRADLGFRGKSKGCGKEGEPRRASWQTLALEPKRSLGKEECKRLELVQKVT